MAIQVRLDLVFIKDIFLRLARYESSCESSIPETEDLQLQHYISLKDLIVSGSNDSQCINIDSSQRIKVDLKDDLLRRAARAYLCSSMVTSVEQASDLNLPARFWKMINHTQEILSSVLKRKSHWFFAWISGSLGVPSPFFT
ncbi:hypothetical protein KP509_18G009400 [Ceratopteris richardii]|uniref:Uncharacterized protein n=1 Tax=Ceratopteris richardii TaxID=49495 RepID=A0A8T2SR29_CERRI|nr:hypothetical protein KP509_18G009400 [Ceratopteris richardii]